MYLWFTDSEYKQLLANGKQTQQDSNSNHVPVVKLFTPDAQCTWLLTDISPPAEGEEPELAFGLCDLGLGCPEMGYVSLTELQELRGNMNLPIEKDIGFEGKASLLEYAKAAREASCIVEDL